MPTHVILLQMLLKHSMAGLALLMAEWHSKIGKTPNMDCGVI